MYAQLMLRCAPMACLGGRSPYEVVTGLKPRFPRSIIGAIPVEEQTIAKYVKDLVESLKEVHSSVQRATLASIERDESTMAGHLSSELTVGDAVLVRREATAERKGPTRFQSRVYDGIYVISKKISPSTFVVEDLVDKDVVPSFTSRFMRRGSCVWTCRSWICSRGSPEGWSFAPTRRSLGRSTLSIGLVRMVECVCVWRTVPRRRASGLT